MDEPSEARPPISLDQTVVLAPSIVARPIDEGLVLVNVNTGYFWELNRLGADIWKELADHGSVRRAFERLLGGHNVAPSVLETDVLALVNELRAQNLVDVIE